MEFKGTKGEWTMQINYMGETNHPTKIISKDAGRTICVPRVNNLKECTANMVLMSHSKNMLETLKHIEFCLRTNQTMGELTLNDVQETINKALNQ